MSSSAPVLSSGLPLLPADLDRTQRGGLVTAVVLAHVALGLVLLNAREPAVVEEVAPAIEVALITQEPTVEVRVPQPPKPTPPVPTPARQAVQAPRAPVQTAPPVVASTAPARPDEMQVPIAPAESKPAPVSAVAEPAPPAPSTNAAPVAATAAPEPPPPPEPKEVPFSAVRYLVQPPADYNRISKNLGETGIVKLRLVIDRQGRLKEIGIAKSSGYPRLDQQAITNMRQARFQPYIENGVPREMTVTAPIEFALED